MNELLQKLFKWKKHIQYEGIDFYIRIVGDQVVDDVRQAAILESRKARRSLRDMNSDLYLLHLDPMKDLEDDELQTAIVLMAARDVFRNYIATTPKRIVPALGSNPSLEDQERYQQELEDRDKEYLEGIEVYTEQWREKFVTTLEGMSRQRLEQMYTRYRTDRVCEDVFNSYFEDALVAASVYSDEEYKTRTFTREEFLQLPNDVKMVFKDAYKSINIESDDLKN